MASNYFAKGMKRSALTVALGLCFVGGVQAQSNTTGSVNGRAAAGDTITVTNPATGFSRTITAGSDGNYRFSSLPGGQYQVSRNGAAPRTVNVSVGGGSNVDFVGGSDATTLDAVTVIGSGAINPIDVSSVESSTILTSEQINKIPVPQNTTAVALLAPGTVRGDDRFGNLASFGGSSVAENQYYINGFNVTNTFNNLSFSQIPFEAIAEQQVKTGGYGAEFGRSTGGVVNQITKRGTNEFQAGGKIRYAPSSLQETSQNFYQDDGTTLRSDTSQNESGNDYTATIWAGGALIKDRLFAYGLIQYGQTEADSYPGGIVAFPGNNTHTESKQPQWMLKLDFSLTDNHLVELTAMSDKREFETDYYAGTYSTATGHVRGAYLGTAFDDRGGDAYVLKYTGYLTDNLTLSALYGHGETDRTNYNVTANGTVNQFDGDLIGPIPGCPQIRDRRPGVGSTLAPRIGCSLGSLGRPDAGDVRDQFRVDAEWQLGDHLVRFGLDTDKFQSRDGSTVSGGHQYTYYDNEYGVDYQFTNGANVEVKQKAFYVEDSWNVTDNFIAYLGLRWDSFENLNGSGETYVEIKNQFAPRLGFSWDVFGDSSFKVFGNAGRYALPITATAAIRGASASLYTYQGFYYDGVDPVTNAPLNRVNAGNVHFINNEFGLPKAAQAIAALDLEPMYQDEMILGFQKQLTDNFSLGVRAIHRDLKRAIDDGCDYRAVVSWALDNGFTVDPVNGFEQEHDPLNPKEISRQNPGFVNCRLFNPGQASTYSMDVNGDGVFETVSVPAYYTIGNRVVNGLNMPKVIENGDTSQRGIRKYTAFEVFWEGNWDDRFFLQGSYTFAKNSGNTEGGVKSDNGQADTGTTQDFDYPELLIGATGYLPNDRRHSLKLFGAWEISEEWRLGANLLVQSGRPINCEGIYGDDPAGYRASYYSCNNGNPANTGGPDSPLDGDSRDRDNGTSITPRGTFGRTPWTQNIDLGLTYEPNWLKGLSLKVDVFNVINKQRVVRVNEDGENSNGQPVNGTYDPDNNPATPIPFNFRTYKLPVAYSAPRSVLFTARYEF